jgi:hypothetical protein
VLLLLAALAVALTWPAAARLGSMARDLGDPLLTTWILAWDVHALATTPFRLFDANMFHPRRGTLAYTEHLLGLVPFAGAARLAGADPVLAHNLVWLATFPLAGLTLFWLVRHLTGHAGAATLAAVLYAFSHFRFGQLSHIQVLSHQWLPLMLLGLHRAAQSGGRWRDVGLATGAFALQALSSGYQAVFAALAGTLFVVWLALPATRPPLGRLIARGAIGAALVALVLVPVLLPYRFVHGEIGLTRDLREIALYAARPWSYLAAPATNRWLGEATARFRALEPPLWPGLALLALALAGAVLAWRRPGAAPPRVARPRWLNALDLALAVAILATLANWLFLGRVSVRLGSVVLLSQRHFGPPLLALAAALAVRRLVLRDAVPVRGLGWLARLGWPNGAGFYVLLTLVGVIGSFGPWLDLGSTRIHPLYRQLHRVVPGFDTLRVPGRLGVLVTTGLAVLAGLAAAALARRLSRRSARALVLGALGALAVLEGWSVPLPLMSVPAPGGPAERWLAARPGADAVLVLPMHELEVAHLESRRLLDSTLHWRPLVNGYAGVFPGDYAADVALLNTFPAPAAVARLRAMHVRYAVVHLGQYQAGTRAQREAALTLLPPGVSRVAAFAHTQIFEIGAEGVRTSGQTGGADEGPRAVQHRRPDERRRLEGVEALRDAEHGVEAITLGQQALAPALLAIDQDDEILHHEAGRLQRLDRLELRPAVRDDVVDHDDALAGREAALDPAAGAVRLLLAPRVDEGNPGRQTGRDRQRQPGVRDAGDAVGPAANDLGRHEAPHLRQHLRVRDHHAQVDVEGRGGARLQKELPESHAADLVEPADERPGIERAHAGISARIAAAAAAGSAAPAIGRPTTR